MALGPQVLNFIPANIMHKSFCRSFLVFIALFGGVLCAEAPANNLSVTNVSLEDRDQAANTADVEFDIDWDNSWRDSDNWDAVWVFFKVSKNSGNWVHGMMQTAGTNPAGTSDGTGTSLTIEVPSDKMGALLYRSSTSTGSVSNNDVTLVLDYNASPLSAGDTDVIEVRVYAIEMVYIPQASYYLGDGFYLPYNWYKAAFWDACDTPDDKTPVKIDSDRPYISENHDGSGTCGDITWYGSGGGSKPYSRTQIGANFPYGYDEFYIMKYEMSQGQYRDFLNTLTSAQSANRVDAKTNNYYAMTNTTSPSHRQAIKYKSSGTPFVCDLDDDDTGDESVDGEWVAMNYMIWPDCAAYADWAGMRPATEMEYEKTCRGDSGSGYVPETGAWETISNDQAEGPISNSGQTSERPGNFPGGTGYHNYDGSGTDTNGPLRVGFAATSSTNRAYAGAGEYGNMELSGNVYEFYVSLGHSRGRAYEGTHGDGVLTTTASYEGNATNTDWPGLDATSARGITEATGIGMRGGAFDESKYYETNISDRHYGHYEDAEFRNAQMIYECGCRLAREP